MLATGGGDAVINIWNDSTAAEKEEAFCKEEEGVLRGQELENAVSDADYAKAIQISFELRRPHRLYELLSELCRKKDAIDHLRKALLHLGKDELQQLFEYIREWNTKPRLCYNAQFVLFQVFSLLSPADIVEVKGIGELLEGLIPYSQRHFSRIDRLERSTFLLDYTLTGMSVIEPEANKSKPENSSGKKVDTEDTAEDPVDVKRESVPEPTAETRQKNGSKKRKSKKSSEVSYKKVKNLPSTEASAVSLQA